MTIRSFTSGKTGCSVVNLTLFPFARSTRQHRLYGDPRQFVRRQSTRAGQIDPGEEEQTNTRNVRDTLYRKFRFVHPHTSAPT